MNALTDSRQALAAEVSRWKLQLLKFVVVQQVCQTH